MPYTAKIINFELLYSENPNVDLNQALHAVVTTKIEKAAHDGYDSIIGLLLVDGFLYKNTQIFYSILDSINLKCNEVGIKKLVLVAGMCGNYQHKLANRKIPFDIIDFDFNLNIVYQSYKDKLDQMPVWNPTADKFLFLGGVPSRSNRITLLYEFYKQGLLSKGEWSFFKPWTTEDTAWCRKELNYLSNQEYETFINYCDRSIDDLYNDSKDYSRASGQQIKEQQIHSRSWCKDPSWIDPQIFINTSVSIISEGNAYAPAVDYNFLTEKTWRTIIHRHPFIFAAESDIQYSYLEKIGLRNFSKYLSNKKYAYIDDKHDRFNSIVTNTKELLESIDQYKDSIAEDIDHNYQVFLNRARTNASILEQLKYDFSLSDQDVDYWFNQKTFVHLLDIL
jgi:hypothetical protein